MSSLREAFEPFEGIVLKDPISLCFFAVFVECWRERGRGREREREREKRRGSNGRQDKKLDQHFFWSLSSSKSSKLDVSAMCLTWTGMAAGRSLEWEWDQWTTATCLRSVPNLMWSQSVPLKNVCALTSSTLVPILSETSHNNLKYGINHILTFQQTQTV